MNNSLFPSTIPALVEQIQAGYQRMAALLQTLSATDLARSGTEGGWAIQDHLTHLVEWRHKLLAMIQGRPGYEGLQIDAQTFQSAGLDGINALLYERNRGRGAAEVLADYHQTHAHLVSVIRRLPDADLARPYDLLDASDPRKLVEGIAGNTYLHDEEHRVMIEAIVDGLNHR